MKSNGLTRLITGSETGNLEKRNVLWNIFGSFLYAFASMVLSIAVVQIAGEDAGGIFTFAFTTFGQHMFMVAYFGIRPFQITDMGYKYSFGDYLSLRTLTCAFALAVGIFYVFVNDYSTEKAAVVFLMVFYKVIDALADTYEAEFQRSGRLHLTGKSNAFRTILSVTIFLAALSAAKNLLTASAAAAGAQLAGFLVFDVMVIHTLPNIEWKQGEGKKKQLFMDNTMLFFGAVLDFYVFSSSKYAVEACMADRDMAVYGAIFMPTSVINLVAGFVIRPYLTKLSLSWETGKTKQFKKQIRSLWTVIAGLTVLAVGGAWLLGIPVLSLLYSNLRGGLAECRPALVLIIFGGAFNAFMSLFYYALVIMKGQRYIAAGYVAVGILAVLLSKTFVRRGGLFGGALIYMILMAVLMVIFGSAALLLVRKREKVNED